jgi:hypothetical protein
MSGLKNSNSKLKSSGQTQTHLQSDEKNDLIFWQSHCQWLEKQLSVICAVPSDSPAWLELRKRTARELLGLDKEGNLATDAE